MYADNQDVHLGAIFLKVTIIHCNVSARARAHTLSACFASSSIMGPFKCIICIVTISVFKVYPHKFGCRLHITLLASLAILWKCMCRYPPFVTRTTFKCTKTFSSIKFITRHPFTIRVNRWAKCRYLQRIAALFPMLGRIMLITCSF